MCIVLGCSVAITEGGTSMLVPWCIFYLASIRQQKGKGIFILVPLESCVCSGPKKGYIFNNWLGEIFKVNLQKQVFFGCFAAASAALQLQKLLQLGTHFTLFFMIFCPQLHFLSNPAAHFSVRQPPPQKKISQQTSSQSKLPRRGRRTTEPLTNFTGPKFFWLSQIFESTCQKPPLFSNWLGEIFNATCQKHPLFSHWLGEIFNATCQKHPLFSH